MSGLPIFARIIMTGCVVLGPLSAAALVVSTLLDYRRGARAVGVVGLVFGAVAGLLVVGGAAWAIWS